MKFKKTLAVMLSVLLVMSFCISAFAGDPEPTTKASIGSVQDALNAVKTALTDIIKEGKLPNGLTIDQIKKTIENALPQLQAPSAPSGEGTTSTTKGGMDISKYNKDISAAVDKALAADKTGAIPPAIVHAFLAQGRTYDEARNAFQALKNQGVISENANSRIQSAIDSIEADDNSSVSTTKGGLELPKVSIPNVTLPNVSLPTSIDGVKGFFQGIINKITGKGGDSPTDSKTANNSKANSSGKTSTNKTEKSPKTGDIGLYAVAAAAVVAGIGIVATKKKKEDK